VAVHHDVAWQHSFPTTSQETPMISHQSNSAVDTCVFKSREAGEPQK